MMPIMALFRSRGEAERPGKLGITPPADPVTLDPPTEDLARKLGLGCNCSIVPGQVVDVHGRYCPAGVYDKALQEARQMCRNLGLDLAPGSEALAYDVAGLVRYAYGEGWLACESRIVSPNLADQIDLAITTPAAVVERRPGETEHGHIVRAIQHTVAYGVKSEPR